MSASPKWRELADGIPPHWASEWGQDKYGIFASFSIGDVTQRMRWIRPGRFMMGSPKEEPGRWDDEGPQHEVAIRQGFWLFDTPCTQELWQAVMGSNPSRFQSPRRPVETVSWDDAQAFLRRINQVPGLDLELELPSEAQWEFACRAGTESAIYTGALTIKGENNAPALDPIAWYSGNSGDKFDLPEISESGTRFVKLKRANAWGLYDMLGNVLEWCEDHWHDSYEGAPADGTPWRDASSTDAERVLRGGSWSFDARFVRSASRDRDAAGYRNDSIGFRCSRGQG